MPPAGVMAAENGVVEALVPPAVAVLVPLTEMAVASARTCALPVTVPLVPMLLVSAAALAIWIPATRSAPTLAPASAAVMVLGPVVVAVASASTKP